MTNQKFNYKSVLLLFAFILLINKLVFSTSNVLNISDMNHTSINKYIYLLNDSSGKVNINTVLNSENNFIPLKPDNLTIQNNCNYWFRLSAVNKNVNNAQYEITIGKATEIEAYVFYNDLLVNKIHSGYLLRAKKHLTKQGYNHNSIISVELLPNKKYDILFRLKNTKGNSKVNFQIQSYSQKLHHSQFQNFIHGIFFGILIIMSIYHLLIFLSVRNSSYVFYSLYLISLLLTFLLPFNYSWFTFVGKYYMLGAIFAYLWQVFPLVAYLLFLQSFIQTKKTMPKWHKLINLINIVLITSPVIAILLYTNNINLDDGFFVLDIVILPVILIILVLLLKIHKLREKSSQFIVIGSIILFICAFFFIATFVFSIHLNFNILNVIIAGIVLQIMIFALGLGKRIKTIEQEKLQSQNNLINQLKENQELQTEVTRKLEQKVKERTSLIEHQKKEIELQRDNLQVNYKILVDKNEEINHQKSLLETTHREITASINYARRIQNAMLPKINEVKNCLPLTFILYKPKDIVSGDFYFFKKINSKIIMMAADCTGHGVPGAFMSILGISKITEIIQRNPNKNAGELLDALRFEIKTALKQTSNIGEQNDGMDAAICVIDAKTKQLNYAGARNSLIICRQHSHKNVEQIELKADSQPIGVFLKERNFTNRYLDLKNNDMIYLYSDGFQSQFGGDKKETYKSKRLKKLLSGICDKTIEEQKRLFEIEFITWKKDNEQLDDILVIGSRISD